jgi:DNA polymerase I
MPKRIFLLDKMSFVYRAYHAAARMPFQMTTKAGFPTGATYVFARMFKKLVQEHKPEFMIACAEGGGSAFREALFPAYKANRKSEGTPTDLARQFPYIDRLLDCYHFPTVSVEGYEADDIIGTLAKKFYDASPEDEIFIVTGDKDMFQLVNERTFIVNPMKDLLADSQKVELIVGVPPAQVTDVMALRGDAVDNIPGAPGIGEKGSVLIIKEFGSLTAALDRAAEVKRKAYRESLQNNRGLIELSHKLVTIACDAPISHDTVPASFHVNDEALKHLYNELEFQSLVGKEELQTVAGFAEINQPEPPRQVDTRTTMSDDQADKLIDSLF